MMIDVGVHSVISLILAFILDRVAHHHRSMATPPALPPPPLPPPPADASTSLSTLKRTHKATQLRSLASRPPGAERSVVNVDPATGKADGPHKKKLRTFLGIVTRDKGDVTYETWKEVPAAQKDLIWEDIQWKLAHTKKTGQMMSVTAKEIAEKIVSVIGIVRPPWTLGCPNCCHWATKASWLCLCCWSRCHHKAILRIGSMNVPQPTAADPTYQEPAGGVDHRKSDSTANGILQPDAVPVPGLALPPEPEVGPSGARVSTKESCVAPSGNDPETGDSDKCGLYIEENPSRPVALGRLYERSTAVHNIPLLRGQVKVCVEEVKDAEALVPMLTDEVTSMWQALNTFLAWPTHLVKSLSEQAVVSPAKPPESPDHEVDDPLYLMTLTIPQLFLKPLQVMWDATMFGVFNQNFSLHLTETSLQAGNSDVYGFLDPQSIQRSGQLQFESKSYIKSWMQSLKRDVYLGAYLNGGHWQMVVILPKENLVGLVLPDNYLKGIINSALKGLDDTPQPKSKTTVRWIVVKCNRQKGSTECGYYVMHWMSMIILGSFRNNWETYFNEVRPLEAERLKALRIQWAQSSI
ncbi:hypothetical protein GmHk_18G051973 [Glycine max]|nr:hypothetical protein GmHk_18G051973 [Glycine max]